MNEQEFKLVLNLIGTERATELRDALKGLDAAGEHAASSLTGMEAAAAGLTPQMAMLDAVADEIAAAFAHGEITASKFAHDLDALAAESEDLATALGHEANAMWASDAAQVQFTKGAEKATSATGKLGAAGVATGKGVGSLQTQIVAGSYALQDFTATSGDLGAKLNSVSNNLPQLLVGLGGLGTALAIGATAGIAVYRNWDSIASLWETRNPFPKVAGDVEGLKRELDRAKDSMEKFEKAGTGSADSIERYNALREKTADLEKRIADEQERQARTQKFLTAKDDATEGRAKAYQDVNKGQGEEQLDRIAEAMKRRADNEIAFESGQAQMRIRVYNAENHTDEEKEKFAVAEMTRFKEYEQRYRANDWAKNAADLNDKLLQGEETAGKSLDRLMSSFPTIFKDMQKRLEDANPVVKKQREEQEAARKQQEDNRKQQEAEAKKVADEKRKRENQLIDELNKQGVENEGPALAENAQIAKDAAEIQKRADDARKAQDKEAERAFERSTKASGVADLAADTLARAHVEGGMEDSRGRFMRLGPEQIEAAVRRQVEAWLHRQTGVDQRGRPVFANPGMEGEMTGLTAQRIVSDAQQQLAARFPGEVKPAQPKPARVPVIHAQPTPKPPAPFVGPPQPRPHPPGWRGPGDQASNDVVNDVNGVLGQVVTTNRQMLDANAQLARVNVQLRNELAQQGAYASRMARMVSQMADRADPMGVTAQNSLRV